MAAFPAYSPNTLRLYLYNDSLYAGMARRKNTSTVMPLMYPLVPGLAATLGLNPVALFSCIYIGGLSTALSPFSTGGALTIASCADKEVKENILPNGMIVASLVIPVICAVLATIGMFGLFHI